MVDEQETLLEPLASDPAALKREARNRNQVHDKCRVRRDEVAFCGTKGWQFDKRLKRTVRLKRLKQADERLENRLWMLLYKLGYPELSQGRNFRVKIKRKGAGPVQKQIDVLAKDDETVIVAECKAARKLARRSLQKDVEEFANLKGPIAKAIRTHYGRGFKPKIVWLFVTERIIWSKPDKDRADGQHIHRVTERELRYYREIADHLGPAARYQFLAEFLAGQEVPELEGAVVPAIRGRLGGRKFYCFVTTPEHLLKLSFVNHRSLNDPGGVPSYQRLISRTRMRQIGKFLKGGGYFPTNVLVNFPQPVRFDAVHKDEPAGVTYGHLYLPRKYQSVWVIDGQHRLYGFAHLSPEYLRENIIVVAFEGMVHKDEAELFVTINHEQKSVPRNLLDDLEGELKWGSRIPKERIGAICARLVQLLNADVGEPFYNRVAQQGIRASDYTCLTIPGIKKGLRQTGLMGRETMKRKIYEAGAFCGPTDAKTLDKARCALNQFFGLVRDANTRQWEMGRAGHLCANVGVQGYLRLLGSLVGYMEANKGLDAKELEPYEIITEIEEYADPVLQYISDASDANMAAEFRVPFGSGGPSEYYFCLCRLVKASFADFSPDGMDEWEAEHSEEKIKAADTRLKEISVWVQQHVFEKLKELYGTERDAYFEKGVRDAKAKTDAYRRSTEDELDDRLPLENYLNFVDYKKVVEDKRHWPVFKSVFDMPEPNEKGRAKNLGWMDRINKLRRIPAHPTSRRRYKAEDFDYIEYVHQQLSSRLAAPRESGEM